MKLRFRYKLVVWLMHRFNVYERMKLYFDWKEFHKRKMGEMFKNIGVGK